MNKARVRHTNPKRKQGQLSARPVPYSPATLPIGDFGRFGRKSICLHVFRSFYTTNGHIHFANGSVALLRHRGETPGKLGVTLIRVYVFHIWEGGQNPAHNRRARPIRHRAWPTTQIQGQEIVRTLIFAN